MQSKNYFESLSSEDKLLYSRITDMIYQCENKYVNKFSFFLDERQCALAVEMLNSLKYFDFTLYGGYDNAKRKVLCIYPPYTEKDEISFPVTPVEFKYRKSDELSHKDFLGTLMSYQIKREVLGDIIVREGSTIVFIYNTAVDFIFNEVTKVGSVGVKLSVYDSKDFNSEETFLEISGTVSSLRLDSIVSLAIKQSREKSSLLIKSTGAEINYKKNYSPDFQLKEGDVFSIRGYGKFILYKIGGMSKKERTHITVKKYI